MATGLTAPYNFTLICLRTVHQVASENCLPLFTFMLWCLLFYLHGQLNLSKKWVVKVVNVRREWTIKLCLFNVSSSRSVLYMPYIILPVPVTLLHRPTQFISLVRYCFELIFNDFTGPTSGVGNLGCHKPSQVESFGAGRLATKMGKTISAKRIMKGSFDLPIKYTCMLRFKDVQ